MSDQSEDLHDKNLRDADLSGANLVGSDLSGADLRDADLSEASLVNANLRDADLRGADLTGAALVNADLAGADLTDTVLTDVSLARANLSDTNIAETDIDGGGAGVDAETPLSSLVSTVVTGATLALAFGLLAIGWSGFWVVFIIGFAGVLPVARKLVSWYESRPTSTEEDATVETSDEQTALERLRERYAQGEIDETEFERRVERLLETESLDEAETFYHDAPSTEQTGTGADERERERA